MWQIAIFSCAAILSGTKQLMIVYAHILTQTHTNIQMLEIASIRWTALSGKIAVVLDSQQPQQLCLARVHKAHRPRLLIDDFQWH